MIVFENIVAKGNIAQFEQYSNISFADFVFSLKVYKTSVLKTILYNCYSFEKSSAVKNGWG